MRMIARWPKAAANAAARRKRCGTDEIHAIVATRAERGYIAAIGPHAYKIAAAPIIADALARNLVGQVARRTIETRTEPISNTANLRSSPMTNDDLRLGNAVHPSWLLPDRFLIDCQVVGWRRGAGGLALSL